MAWAVDTCLLLDVALPDPKWAGKSARLIGDKLGDGLVVCPVTVVELAPAFHGDMADVFAFLDAVGVDAHAPWLELDTRAAMPAWTAYVEQRRKERLARRPIADILIGAFAMRHQGLLTRNPDDFRRWLPKLKLVEP